MITILDKLINWIRILFVDGEVYYINGSETLPPPLEKEEEDLYFTEYQNGSMEARDKLIEHNLRLVVYVAKKYETNIVNLEDLISIGTIGLIKSISTFKSVSPSIFPTRASRFFFALILTFFFSSSERVSFKFQIIMCFTI